MLTKPHYNVARIAWRSVAGPRRWMGVVFACGVLVLAGALHAAGTPAMDQLNTLLAQRHYHRALQTATLWLNLNRRAMRHKHLTRYELQCVRARAMLRISAFAGAVDAFRAAAAVAPTIPDARQSRAMAGLIDHSFGGVYKHRVHQSGRLIVKSFNIVPKASRQQAMQALARDQWKKLHPRIILALRRASLDSSLRLLPELRLAVDVQSAAAARGKGPSAAKSEQPPALAAVDSISAHLAVRITAGLTALQASVNNIQRLANEKVRNGRTMVRRGVNSDQRNTLEDIGDTCSQVQRAIAKFVKLFGDFPKDVAVLQALNGRARQVQMQASRVH